MTIIHILDFKSEPANCIRTVAEEMCLDMTSDGTLRTYPGSRHWHLKRSRQAGTLEVTHWPQQNRVWVSYHSNRSAEWVAELAPLFARSLADRLDGRIAENPS